MEERDEKFDNRKNHDDVIKNYKNLNIPDLSNMMLPFQTIVKMQQTIAESVAPMLKSVMEIQQSVQPIIEQIGKFVSSINWSKLQDAIKQRLQHYEEFMSIYDKECWAMTPEMLDAFEDEEYSVTEIEKYVEDHLNEYIMFFQEDPLYNKNKLLIQEAYELFKREFYMHCAFSLLAIFEEILNTAFSIYELGKDVKINNRRPDLFIKTQDYIKSNEERLAFNILFFRRVYNVYNIIFKPHWEDHPDQINRNWIAHGKYNYESITKTDILKLFQLLKASSILNEISFESDK